jgi:hypothetical protein
MDPNRLPRLKFLHSHSTLNEAKLEQFRRVSTETLILVGYHRLSVLVERVARTSTSSPEIMEKSHDPGHILDIRPLARALGVAARPAVATGLKTRSLPGARLAWTR